MVRFIAKKLTVWCDRPAACLTHRYVPYQHPTMIGSTSNASRGESAIMVTTVILPVARYQSRLILSGKKTAYVSAVRPRQQVDSVLLYETKPTMGVIGAASVSIQAFGSPRQIWKYYGKAIAQSQEQFDARWENKDTISVLELYDAIPFTTPHPVTEFGVDRPPHGITYIPDRWSEQRWSGILEECLTDQLLESA